MVEDACGLVLKQCNVNSGYFRQFPFGEVRVPGLKILILGEFHSRSSNFVSRYLPKILSSAEALHFSNVFNKSRYFMYIYFLAKKKSKIISLDLPIKLVNIELLDSIPSLEIVFPAVLKIPILVGISP